MLRDGKAAVYRRYPFTIIMKQRATGDKQPIALKLDPGSKVTGIALVAEFKRGQVVVWAGELHHRGQAIKDALDSRRGVRRGRRNRKTRYRKPRFLNRRRPTGWLSPSVKSRVFNVEVWSKRLVLLSPVTAIAVETVRFDMQKMDNPEIAGIQYQRGDLFGFELKEYLLFKWGHECAYCGKANVPLQIEHITPRSRGGSNRTSNLTLSCKPCNKKKDTMTAAEFGYPEIQAKAKLPLKDAAALNAIRYAIGNRLKALGLQVSFCSGGRTKFNRVKQGYPKTHWIDAACVGDDGVDVIIKPDIRPLVIKAKGHGNRQICGTDKFGFPIRHRSNGKTFTGFHSGDIVRAIIPKGKHAGIYVGRVLCRATGYFDITTQGRPRIGGISHRFCSTIHLADGYQYNEKGSGHSSRQ